MIHPKNMGDVSEWLVVIFLHTHSLLGIGLGEVDYKLRFTSCAVRGLR